MILLCELSFLGRAHVPFNAGLLATIQGAFPTENLSFWGAATHVEELKQQLGLLLTGSIVWNKICPPYPETSYPKRFWGELSVIRNILGILPDNESTRLVLTSAYPSTVVALKVAQHFSRKRTSVQIILHGASGVAEKRYRRPLRRLQDMRTALTVLGNSGIQYLVLEESIRKAVLDSLPFLSGKIEVLEHPISPNEGTTQIDDLNKPIRFGFLGLADHAKGFPVFQELAKHISAKYGHQVEFHAIGHLPKNENLVSGLEALSTKPANTLMSREQYVNAVKRLHFIVLPHQAQSYNLTASGVLLDAITWGKPVIARKIPIFETLFERYGEIGYLFDNDEELKTSVETILTAADEPRYRNQIVNLRRLQKARAPASLAAAYLDMCRKGGIPPS
jgi:hypothetical protein